MIKKVALIGSHGSGKTTCLYSVAYEYKMKKNVIGVLHEVARECPYPINDKADFISQWWMLTHQIENEARSQLLYDRIISDRSVFDNVPYTELLRENGNMKDWECVMINKTALNWATYNPYSALIYLTPLPIEEDKARGTNQRVFQLKIDTLFNELFHQIGDRENIIKIEAQGKEERQALVLEVVKKYFGSP